MNQILKIDYKSQIAPTDFVKSLSTTGFAVIYNHDIDLDYNIIIIATTLILSVVHV